MTQGCCVSSTRRVKMRLLSFDECQVAGGGLEKCEMSEPTKVQMAVLVLVSPVMGVAALATYWAHRDC